MNTTAGGGPRRRTCLAAAAALPLATLAGCTTPAPAGRRSVTILHFNDTHGRHRPFAVAPGNATAQTGEPRRHEAFDRAGLVGGYAAMASAVAEARRRHGADRVLLLHGGDAFSDDLLGNLSGGEATVRCLNALGVDALALGNHDFDYGVSRTRQLQTLARFPMRGANVLDEASGEPFLGEPVQRFERGGVRVGLLCLGYHNTPDTASAEHLRGLRFGSGIDAARRWLPALRATSDLVVVLSHQGSAVDRVLARSVPGIDLIVGAHSHDAISPPERVGDSWIVQALSDGAALGEVTVALDASGRIERVDGRLHVLWADRWAADPGMAALVESLRAPHRAQLEAPLGRAAERIGRRYRAPSPFDVLVGELLIERTGAELALLPGVGYGVSLEPGVVTREALHALLPHPSRVVTAQLRGGDLLQALEQNATNLRPADPMDRVGGLLQTAGLHWTLDLGAPAGRRVREVRIGGAPLDPARGYRVATHQGLLGGLHRLHSLQRAEAVQPLPQTVAELVEAALRENGTLRAPRMGEVRLVDTG